MGEVTRIVGTDYWVTEWDRGTVEQHLSGRCLAHWRLDVEHEEVLTKIVGAVKSRAVKG